MGSCRSDCQSSTDELDFRQSYSRPEPCTFTKSDRFFFSANEVIYQEEVSQNLMGRVRWGGWCGLSWEVGLFGFG